MSHYIYNQLEIGLIESSENKSIGSKIAVYNLNKFFITSLLTTTTRRQKVCIRSTELKLNTIDQNIRGTLPQRINRLIKGFFTNRRGRQSESKNEKQAYNHGAFLRVVTIDQPIVSTNTNRLICLLLLLLSAPFLLLLLLLVLLSTLANRKYTNGLLLLFGCLLLSFDGCLKSCSRSQNLFV